MAGVVTKEKVAPKFSEALMPIGGKLVEFMIGIVSDSEPVSINSRLRRTILGHANLLVPIFLSAFALTKGYFRVSRTVYWMRRYYRYSCLLSLATFCMIS
jgi:hypothetical protein